MLAGEDGFVKVWSRNGLLRSTIVQSDAPCYSAVWSPDCSAILYSKGNVLTIKQLNSSTKMTKVRFEFVCCFCILIINFYPFRSSLIFFCFLIKRKLLFQWKAHEGIILCVAWNANNNLIISGAEDGFSKVIVNCHYYYICNLQ